jgi:hypothetical protein
MSKVLERATANSPMEVKRGANSLLVSLANAMNSRQEVGAPMVVATLMGWAPRIASHTPKKIYLGDVHRVLQGTIFLGQHPLRYETFCKTTIY